MADSWVPADQVAKNDAGQFVARFGDKWEPVLQAAKNDAGQFVVLRNVQGLPNAPDAPKPDNSIGRQVGLTARAGLEGVGGLVSTLAEPIRLPLSAGLRAAGLRDTPIPNAQELARSAADAVGLPSPGNATERIAGDAASAMAGGGAAMKVANVIGAAATSPTLREVLRQFVANPTAQTAAAAGAGGAGSYEREQGGGMGAQLLASVLGGVGAGMATNAAGRAVDAGKRVINDLRAPAQGSIELDATIQNILGPGVNWQELPQHVRNQLRGDVQQAMRQGPLTPDAVRRLADYRLAEAVPSRAGLTLDPVDITQQRNLSKFGANSRDRAVQSVARLENENAKSLARGVGELGGNVVDDAYVNSGKAVQALNAIDEARRAEVGSLYAKARDSLGRAAPLDPATATQNAGLALAEAQAGGSLPSAAQSILNKVATGEIPFNVDTKEQMVKILGQMAQGATRGDERTAINIVRKALDDAPLLETHGLGPDALEAFKAARTAHARRMAAQEANPALKAVAEGMEPDKFFDKFVIGGKVRELGTLRNELGKDSEAWQAMRGQLVAYLKQKGGVSEDAGTFNSASFNNALKALGNEKLKVFFSGPELEKLQAIGRVARYEQVQPRGSAVNNSNTGGAVFNLLERLADSSAVTRIPIVGGAPQNIVMRVRANQAQNVPAAISGPTQSLPSAPITSPALAALLGVPQGEDNRKKRPVDVLLTQ